MRDHRPQLPDWIPGGRPRADEDAPLFRFNRERQGIVEEVTARAVETLRGRDLSGLLLDAAYLEQKRLERSHDPAARAELGRWREIARRVQGSPSGLESIAADKIREHAWDIAGNFDPRVYRIGSRVVPVLLQSLLQPSSVPAQLAGDSALASRVLVVGEHLDTIRTLSKIATLVVTPTHVSNMDSLLIGYALERQKLPPMTYGAGKNLFTNPLISFFMHNLGAYRVDRRIRHDLYKHVLKTYSTVITERGYHSIFFPGGTRSRSGSVESKLKLGLLGTGIEAFTRNLRAGKAHPLVVYVPTTINFLLTLEAESLIEDYLQEAGKAQYIIEDDEFSRADRWLSFFKGMLRMQAAIQVRFGTPIDPFGNEVGPDGRCYDARGRVIDPASYVLRGGEPVVDADRDAELTRELGTTLVRHFARETVIMSSHLVARVLFERLGAAFPDADLFQRLRVRWQLSYSIEEVHRGIELLRARLLELERGERLRLTEVVRTGLPSEILDRALSAWRDYHGPRAPAEVKDGRVSLGDPKVLFYYQNRLSVFAKLLGPDVTGAARAAEVAS